MEQVGGVQSPVKLEVEYPESSSRILALCGIVYVGKALILLPVIVVYYIVSIALVIAIIVGMLATLFTGKYPRGLFDFNVRVMKWALEINFYFVSMTDKYPPFFPK